jgi:hypothetical protein
MLTPRLAGALLLVASLAQAAPAPTIRILTNHLGYDARGSKKFVVESDQELTSPSFQIVDEQFKVVLAGVPGKFEKVDNWKRWRFWRGDFSTLEKAGNYRVRVTGPRGDAYSEPFAVKERLLSETALSDLVNYFRSQRVTGPYDRADRHMKFSGQKRAPVDVHGGWYDASGDVSKYFSHLSYANYLNPQQTPLAVWALLESSRLLEHVKSDRLQNLRPRLEEEAIYGADFLVRMQDPAGYFYSNVFDVWTADPKKREISAFKSQHGERYPDYQAAFREGGGMAIAALARASTLAGHFAPGAPPTPVPGAPPPPPPVPVDLTGDYPASRYLAVAEKGFAHLQANNLKYDDDHQENIIDDYCALMAASELFNATKKPAYLKAARQRADSLRARLQKDEHWKNFWRADAKGDRPYFHAAEAGLPVLALLRYRAIETDPAMAQTALQAVHESLAFELAITHEVANPFGYARQYVKPLDGAKRSSFFIPHKNESNYWWQGENARLGSLATAAFLASREAQGTESHGLRVYAVDQLDWILGLNPLDMSMLQGRGRNNPDYLPVNPNVPGGVCNGFTSGFEDEHDIAFMPAPQGSDPEENWRWAEQWIPHAAWLTLGLAAQAAVSVSK